MLRSATHLQVRAWVLQSHLSTPSCSSLLCALSLSFPPISSLIPVLRSRTQVTGPTLLGRSCDFNLHSVCAASAMPGRVFPLNSWWQATEFHLLQHQAFVSCCFSPGCVKISLNDREMGMLSSSSSTVVNLELGGRLEWGPQTADYFSLKRLKLSASI